MMKNWLKQRTTWVAFAAALAAGLTAFVDGADWKTAAMAAVAALGAALKDKAAS